METDIDPIEIIQHGISQRYTSLSQIVSDTGKTVYVGSRKSQQFLRIYRYEPPHERSHLLRFEFVFKKGIADKIAASLIQSDYDYAALAAMCRDKYAIQSPIWPEKGTPLDVAVDYDQRTAPTTLRWLMTSVAPAFRRLVDNGVIEDPEQFLMTYFLKGRNS